MKVTYDKEVDAVYIEFASVQELGQYSDKTQGEWPINVNITKDGTLMGIEILEASTILSQDFLDKALRVDTPE